MPANHDIATPPFTDEEKKQFSPILKLRKANSAHFRREFKELGEQQSRFLEYVDMKALQAEKEPMPILNGFRLAEQPQLQDLDALKRKEKRRRCTLL